MSKSIEQNDGIWYIKETLPLEEVIKNLSTNSTFRLETISGLPKLSFVSVLPLSQKFAYSEYRLLKVECQLSRDSIYWEIKLWVYNGSADLEISSLASLVLSANTPDAQFMIGFSEIDNILKLSEMAAYTAILSKRFSSIIPAKLQPILKIVNIEKISNEGGNEFPKIIIETSFSDPKMAVIIELDISNGVLNIEGMPQNLCSPGSLNLLELPPAWLAKRESLLGANSNPNSITASLRLAEFLEDNKQWSSQELIEDALLSLNNIVEKLSKNKETIV
jgi:hypothetical protein